LRRRTVEGHGLISFRVPGHPWTTLLFIGANWLIVISTFAHDPRRSFIGLGIALAGLPVYHFWRARQ
jgi:APA family basic amino acid/polyamine antiporter